MAGTITGLVEPLGEFTQFVGEKLNVSCNTKPGVFGVQEMSVKPGAAGTILSVGALVICTAVGKTQSPPVTEY